VTQELSDNTKWRDKSDTK